MLNKRRAFDLLIWLAVLGAMVMTADPERRLSLIVWLVPLGLAAFFAGEWHRSRRRARHEGAAVTWPREVR